MTRDEAHRRAIEAACNAAAADDPILRQLTTREEWCETITAAITAYFDAMVLPIEEAPNKETILVFYDTKEISLVQAEENDYEWQSYQPRGRVIASPKFFTFSPEPPK